MNRFSLALLTSIATLSLSACAGGYGLGGNGYAGGSYAYDGFYDDSYGPIYDGYWGNDGGFYYRSGEHDRRFRRGDPSHFSRSGAPGSKFHAMQGSMTPGRGMRMPHFGGGGQGRPGQSNHGGHR
jgi:hypothetical protein